MPANIAHMVIVHKAFELLRRSGFNELAAFARMIDDPARREEDDYWKYMNLGSLGPDLYYYVSHVAADQIIHPLINRIAKPYYRSGQNRKKHRQCEVFQDYFLYEEVYRDKRAAAQGPDKAVYDFFRQDFTEARRKRFESIVRNADLSCPLQGNILETARRELTKKAVGGAKYQPLFETSP